MAAPLRSLRFHQSRLQTGFHKVFCTCGILNVDPARSKTMQKLLNKANRKKDSKWFSPTFTQTQPVDKQGLYGPSMTKRKRIPEGQRRRAAQLSTILYENISQIIGIGELDMYVEITKVIIVPDMSSVNVYWEASGDATQDNETQRQLEARSGQLRHTLLTSHALGNIPRIVFVKDLSTAKQKQFDDILKTVDLGPEYVKNEQGHWVLAEQASDNDSHDTDNEAAVEVEILADQGDESEDIVASFRQDVYGLQHDAIMKKVIDSKLYLRQRPNFNQLGNSKDSESSQMSVKQLSQFFRHQKKKDMISGNLDNSDLVEDDIEYDDGFVHTGSDSIDDRLGK